MKLIGNRLLKVPLIISFFLITCTGQLSAQDIDFTSSNLPILLIDTHGERIVDPVRIPADLKIIHNGAGERNNLEDTVFHYDGKIGIELRGSTSQNWPKQPYRFEIHDSLGEDWNVPLLGMPEENDWILNNPWSDKTLLRNVLSYKISNDLGRYATRTKYCELWLNGQYRGVYVLMEKLKRDRNRVDIARMDSSDVEGDDLTGGYIIKIDKSEGEQRGGWRSEEGTQYKYHYPKPSVIMDVQKEYIQDFMDGFEKVMVSPGWNDADTGYTEYFDVDAFIDFCIVNEISKNIDGYRLSTFMYKDRDSDGGLLTLGPVWDFNLSFGNSYYYDGASIGNWNLETLIDDTGGDFAPPFWMETIWDDATFQQRFKERWQSVRQTVLKTETLLEYIDLVADTLDEAQQRNFTVWPILGQYEWPNFFIGETWEEEIEHLKEWTQGRLEWIDQAVEAFAAPKTDVPGLPTVVADEFKLDPNYPNPFNPSTTISYHLAENSLVKLSIFNSIGQEVRRLVDLQQAGGSYNVIWDGRDKFGQHVPSGVYTYRLQSDNRSLTRKMLMIQ